MTLPAAPVGVVGRDGAPLCGRYTGPTGPFDWSQLGRPYRRSALWRRFHHKRWHFVGLATGELFCGIAIVDVGWTNTAFAYAFDRRQRKVVAAYSQEGLPGLTAQVGAHVGEASHFRILSNRIELAPDGAGGYRLALHCGDFNIDAQFDGQAPFLLAVGDSEGGSVHATQKSPALALSGLVRIRGVRYDLAGGVANLDYSNGLLARETAWIWASAHRPGLGINLQTGHFGSAENALWVDGVIAPLGAAVIEGTAAEPGAGGPPAPWRLRTRDNLLDLTFTPEGARRDDKNLLVAASRLTQLVGVYDGWVKPAPHAEAREVRQLVGLLEDFWTRW